MIKDDTPESLIIKRIEGLERGHNELKRAIAHNTNITKDGIEKISNNSRDIGELLDLYKSAKIGGTFLKSVGTFTIAVAGAWAIFKAWIH